MVVLLDNWWHPRASWHYVMLQQCGKKMHTIRVTNTSKVTQTTLYKVKQLSLLILNLHEATYLVRFVYSPSEVFTIHCQY